jgi:hypothetical protein
LNQLETLWLELDRLFGSLTADEWVRPHGPNRTFADVPMHLANFDREVIVASLAHEAKTIWSQHSGLKLPINITHWPPAQVEVTAHLSLQTRLNQMKAARDSVRMALLALTDDDLDRPIWLAIQNCGWVRLQVGLAACHWHAWDHCIQAHLRLKLVAPSSDPVSTYAALNFMLHFWLVSIIDQRAAREIEMQIEWTFTGSGGGQWTMDIADGQVIVNEGQALKPDIAFIQSPETFVKTLHRLHDPMVALLTGEMKVRGFECMHDFDRLFPDLKSSVESNSMVEQ